MRVLIRHVEIAVRILDSLCHNCAGLRIIPEVTICLRWDVSGIKKAEAL